MPHDSFVKEPRRACTQVEEDDNGNSNSEAKYLTPWQVSQGTLSMLCSPLHLCSSVSIKLLWSMHAPVAF
jgi:hypothetical protein